MRDMCECGEWEKPASLAIDVSKDLALNPQMARQIGAMLTAVCFCPRCGREHKADFGGGAVKDSETGEEV